LIQIFDSMVSYDGDRQNGGIPRINSSFIPGVFCLSN